ncbi:NYN domain-containing protein [Spongiactinospora rosea]|uniref:NYN domain-containing protein n=1 Tax=Spongiactinospora rosea TaxID=2248750 RepID=A0A366LZE2_9ACTN|nr:NYN domain-containing protein [Spongiactinospora rosea]RBQ18684.1 NYN domain-containing protein [Spongiactinospora rosea]
MTHNQNPKSEAVAAYIDGFNLYHGIRPYGRRYLWLDLEAMTRRLLRPHQRLASVRYFTAPIRNDPAAQTRQNAYLGALQAHTSVDIVLGRFQERRRQCHACGATWRTYEEKESDVAIALAMIEDAVRGGFDKILLVSGDSDFCVAVRAVRRLNPAVGVIVVFPPGRRSDVLGRAAHGRFFLGIDTIRRSQLPPLVPGPAGLTYTRPKSWS